MRANSLDNKFYILVEVTRIYKTFSYCFSYLLKDRQTCVINDLVNYFYIAFSLEVKVRWKTMKFAEHKATSLFRVKPNNKVYSNIDIIGIILSNKIQLDRNMSVGVC